MNPIRVSHCEWSDALTQWKDNLPSFLLEIDEYKEQRPPLIDQLAKSAREVYSCKYPIGLNKAQQTILFTDHGEGHHIPFVLDLLYKIFREYGSKLKPKLNGVDLYVLCAATILHDIGMFTPEYSAKDIEIRRENHEEASLISEIANNFFLSLEHFDFSELITPISNVVLWHREKYDINHPDLADSSTLTPIHQRILAALLRLADECDVIHKRSPWGIFDAHQQEKGKILSYKSVNEWKKHFKNIYIEFEPDIKTIKIGFKPDLLHSPNYIRTEDFKKQCEYALNTVEKIQGVLDSGVKEIIKNRSGKPLFNLVDLIDINHKVPIIFNEFKGKLNYDEHYYFVEKKCYPEEDIDIKNLVRGILEKRFLNFDTYILLLTKNSEFEYLRIWIWPSFPNDYNKVKKGEIRLGTGSIGKVAIQCCPRAIKHIELDHNTITHEWDIEMGLNSLLYIPMVATNKNKKNCIGVLALNNPIEEYPWDYPVVKDAVEKTTRISEIIFNYLLE